MSPATLGRLEAAFRTVYLLALIRIAWSVGASSRWLMWSAMGAAAAASFLICARAGPVAQAVTTVGAFLVVLASGLLMRPEGNSMVGVGIGGLAGASLGGAVNGRSAMRTPSPATDVSEAPSGRIQQIALYGVGSFAAFLAIMGMHADSAAVLVLYVAAAIVPLLAARLYPRRGPRS